MQRTDLAFPDHHNSPATFSQLPLSPFVPGGIALHLRDPVTSLRRRNTAPGAPVKVPETAIDIDDFPQSWKHEIRSTGEGADMQTVTVPQRVNEPPNY